MAVLHRTTLRPSKPELLAAWLPRQPWSSGRLDGAVEIVAGCRLDDPAGEVGIELMLLRREGGDLCHVPLTYRDAPLGGVEPVGTAHHGVLGRRWVYDGDTDPVFHEVVAGTIRTGGTQAEEVFTLDGREERREPSLTVRGDGQRLLGRIAATGDEHVLVQLDSGGSVRLRRSFDG